MQNSKCQIQNDGADELVPISNFAFCILNFELEPSWRH